MTFYLTCDNIIFSSVTFWEIAAHSIDHNYVFFVSCLFVISVISQFGFKGWILDSDCFSSWWPSFTSKLNYLWIIHGSEEQKISPCIWAT